MKARGGKETRQLYRRTSADSNALGRYVYRHLNIVKADAFVPLPRHLKRMKTSTESGVVYLLTSPSGKQYVGQSWEFETRMSRYRLNKPQHHHVINHAIDKYGWNNFTATIIAQGIETQDALDATEDAFIMLLNTLAPNGYNLKRGGATGKHHADSIEKMRRPKSPEHRAKIKMSNLGHIVTTETRRKLRKAHLGKPKPSLQGRPKSPETVAKLIETKAANSTANIEHAMPLLLDVKTKAAIANAIGVSRANTSRLAWRSNTAHPTIHDFRETHIDRVMEMLSNGETQRAIAKEIGVTPSTICCWIKKTKARQVILAEPSCEPRHESFQSFS